MSAKNEAFTLFGQGKKPDAPELKVLGLTPKTIRKYYYQWQQQRKAEDLSKPEIEPQPEPEAEPLIPVAAPTEVPLGSLKVAQLFTFQDATYRVAEVTPEFVRATKLREISIDLNETMLLVIGQATLATSTLVKPE